MTEETQVHTTSQDAESTQQDDVELLDQSPSEPDEQQDADATPDSDKDGKEPEGWELKRIGQLTRQRHEAERKADAAQAEAARYRQLVEQMQRGEEPEVTRAGQEPDIDALVTKRAAELSQQQAAAERGVSVSKAGAEAYQDFQSAVKTLDAIGISDDQVRNLLGLDDAHKVIYQLGKNPDEAMRILSLPPLQQGRELERMAAKAANPAPKAVSKAPAPVKPVDGRANVDPDPSSMSMEEWAKWRAKTAKTRV